MMFRMSHVVLMKVEMVSLSVRIIICRVIIVYGSYLSDDFNNEVDKASCVVASRHNYIRHNYCRGEIITHDTLAYNYTRLIQG
jgi:hypothetical protein